MAGDPRYHENASDCPGTTWFSAGLVTIDTRFGDRRYLPGNARSDLYNCVFCAYVGGDVSQTAEPYARVSPALERRVRGCTL